MKELIIFVSALFIVACLYGIVMEIINKIKRQKKLEEARQTLYSRLASSPRRR